MKVDNVKMTKSEVSYKMTLEITDDELRYILHRLNMNEDKFKKTYDSGNFNKLCEQVSVDNIWCMFDDVLDGEFDD